jgi:hypothetical protein
MAGAGFWELRIAWEAAIRLAAAISGGARGSKSGIVAAACDA